MPSTPRVVVVTGLSVDEAQRLRRTNAPSISR
jgi:hypothetical protein